MPPTIDQPASAGPIALSWSGGKDSTLALDRLRRAGADVRWLFNVFEGSSGRIRFHGVRAGLICAQAASLGIELLQKHTHPDDFETVFLDGLRDLRSRGARALAFGNIHLSDVRAWYEQRTVAYGFMHLEPLWGGAPRALASEFLARGYRTLLVSLDLARAPRAWLGAELHESLLDEIVAYGADAAGEAGEYHTFVFDGPGFSRPIDVQTGETVEIQGHLLIDLTQ